MATEIGEIGEVGAELEGAAGETAQGFRLSPQQLRLFTLQGRALDLLFRAWCVVELTGLPGESGDILPGRLAAALAAVVDRHEILRTTFRQPRELEVPLQTIEPAAPALERLVETAPPDEDLRTAKEGLIERLSTFPFDLAAGPSLHVELVSEDYGRKLLGLALPGLCADRVSLHHLVREIAEAYDGELSTEPPLQYADVSEWLNGLLEGSELAAERHFWQRVSDAVERNVRLPFANAVPDPLELSPRREAAPFPAAWQERVADLAAAQGTTSSVVLLACWYALLARLTGGSEVTVAVLFEGRTYEGFDAALGSFARVLPVRVEMKGGRFQELLSQVNEAVGEADAAQDGFLGKRADAYPYGFDFEELPPAVVAGGISFAITEQYACLDRTELKLRCVQGDDGLALELHYDPRVFSPEDVTALAERYLRLVGSVLDTPGLLEDLEVLTAEERRLFLATPAPTTFAASDWVHEQFEREAERAPRALAAIFDGEELSYGDLNARANRLAHALRRRGVEPDARVAICMGRTAEFLVGLLATLKAGGAFVPLDPGQPAERLRGMLAELGAAVLLTERGLVPSLAGLSGGPRSVLALDTDWEAEVSGESAANPAGRPAGENLAYVIFTSGSTGLPKGVGIEHRQLANYVASIVSKLDLPAGASFALVSTFAADLGHTMIFPALCRGGSLHVLSERQLADPEILAEAFCRRGIDCLKIVPSHLEALLAACSQPASLVPRKRLVLGGEATRLPLVAQLRHLAPDCRIFNHYGPTETTVGVLAFPLPAGWENGKTSVLPLGTPLANTRVHVLDRHRSPVPFWVAGELYIGGANVGRGYLENPVATAEKFAPDPWSSTGGRLYRTGDLVRLRPDGILEFLGRADDQVKVRGNRVEPGEIAAALCRHPGVAQATVVAREEAPGELRLIAYWVGSRTGATGLPSPPETPELRAFLAGQLPAYMVPGAFVRLPALPLTANGKVDRRALPEPAELNEAEGDLFSPRTPTEEILAGVWSEVLGRERIGVTQNFFDLGGHSLLATQVVSRVRRAFGIDLALRSLLESPSVAGLAEVVDLAVRSGEGRRLPPMEPARSTEAPPLSFAQQRLWFLDQLDPGSAAYNLPAALRLRGALDIAALGASLSEIVRRHETLRASFPTEAGRAGQRIAPPAPVALAAVDLAGLPVSAREAEIGRLAEREAQRPFDLGRGPLLRLTLLVLGRADHAMLVTLHHIVSDGWSRGVLIQELGALYGATVAGRPSPLPELPLQYGDFAVWQRSWLSGEVLEAEIAYWRGRLGEAPAPLELPTDRPRSTLRTLRAGQQSWTLAGPLFGELQRFSRRRGATLFMALLSGFQALLSRYTGQTDIAVGSPIAGRNQLQTEGLIGFFVNTLVLRTALSGDPDGATLVDRVREVTLGAYAHQDVPFEKLVSELQPDRDLSRTPFFQVVLALQNAPARALELPGLVLESLPAASGNAKFDLTCMLYDDLRGVSGVAEFNRDLFDGPTISRWLSHFGNLIGAMVATPALRLSELPLLSAGERSQLVDEWNDTAAESQGEACLHQLFETQVERSPTATAVSWPGGKLSYAELNRRSNQLAHHLASLGVGVGDRVAIHLERSSEMIVAVLGVLKTGAAYVPLDSAYPEARIAWILGTLGIRHLVTEAARLPRVDPDVVPTAVEEIVCLGEAAAEADPADSRPRLWDRRHLDILSDVNPRARVDAEDLAYIIFTSGTTGTPKGVMVHHRPVVNLIRWVNRSFSVGPDDRLLFLTSLCFDLSVYDILGILGSGGSIRVTSETEAQDPRRLLAILLDEPITFWDSAPAALQQLVAFLPEPGSVTGTENLRLVFLSGDWIPISLPDRIRDLFPRSRVVALGGATEAAIWSNFHPVEVVSPLWVSIPYGRPISNARYHVLDTSLAPSPIGVAGDLYIGGGCLFSGYAQEPVLTAEKLVPDALGEVAGGRLYRTGDRARHWADGTLEFLGRADHQVKIRGYRIELGEIEATLSQHPGVHVAVAIVREDRPGDRRLVAYVVAEPGAEVAISDLRDFLLERLPAYMVPTAFVLLPRLPVTANGKLDRRALPAPAAPHAELAAAGIAPRTEVEQILASIWTEVLGLDRVSIDSNFFELGGDSILSIQVISRASQAGLQLNPRQLFESPTIAGLAQVAVAASAVAEVGPEDGPVPLTPIQRWFFEQNLVHPEHFNQALLLNLAPPAGASRIAGPLLALGLQRVVAHHDALRLRFVAVGPGDWRQASGDGPWADFSEIDLTALSAAAGERALAVASAGVQGSLNLAAGPLLRAALLRGGGCERLLIVAHHLVIDGVSWRILLEDLETAYRQLAEGGDVRLASKTVPFRAWAERLALSASLDLHEREAAYWLEGLSRPATELPPDLPGDGPNLVASARSVSVALGSDETRALLKEAPRAYRTQINDLLLTALVEAFGRLTGRRQLLFDLEGHGRDLLDGLDVSRTLGWFTNLFPVRLDLEGTLGAGDAIRSIKEKLRAVPGRGLAYSLLRYLGEGETAERLRALPRAGVLFNYLGQLDGTVAEGRLFRPAREGAGPMRHGDQRRSHPLEVNCAVSDGCLQASFTYSANRYRRATVERLAESFIASLRALVAHCLSAEAGGFTPSDFPLARLDAPTLERLEAATAGAIEDVYPASAVQRGMIFHALESPGSGVYVGQFKLDLGRDLDVQVFQEAWRLLVDRHSILRTSFFGTDLERPLQVVQRGVEPEWSLLDWRDLSAADRQKRLGELLATDRRRGFDITTAPLLRLALIDLGEDGYQFLWTLLFVLLDGWSMPILLRELFALYQAGLRGEEAKLPPARPYRDYIAWLEHQDLAAAEAFWRRSLGDFTAPTALGIDLLQTAQVARPGAEAAGERPHAERKIVLSVAVTEQLRGFARRQQLTINTLTQGAWALLLGRYSSENDVVFGAVTSGRSAPVPGIESIAGLFLNTLPVRALLPPGAPLGKWLEALQESQAEVRQFEHSPLAEIQGWSGVPRGQRLFDSILIFENFPVDDSVRQQAGRALGMGETEVLEQTNFPLSLFVNPAAQLSVKALFETGLFAAVDVARMLRHLAVLLAAFPVDLNRPLVSLPMLQESERHQLLVEWNDTHRSVPPLLLHRLFTVQAERTPEARAVVVPGEAGDDTWLSYADLDARSNRLARYLARLGVGPDDLVLIAAERSLELMVGLLGVLKAGGAFVPLDPSLPPDRLTFMLRDAARGSRSPVLLTQERLLGSLSLSSLERTDAATEPAARVLCLDADWPLISAESDLPLAVAQDPDHLAYMIYTSGSTGRPKGAMNTHGGICNRLLWMQEKYGLMPDDRLLQKTTLSFDDSVIELFWALANGAQLVMARPEGHRDSGYLASVIARAGITHVHFVPSMLQAFLEEPEVVACRALRLVIVSGEALPPYLSQLFFDRLDAELHNLYGPAEVSVDVTSHACRREETGSSVPIGRTIHNLSLHLLDVEMRPVPMGVAGELVVGGVGLGRGYHGRPDLTAERFVPDPFGPPGTRLYRTGDLSRWLPDGEVEFLGRIDHQVKIRGNRIELGEVEAALSGHPAVRQNVVVARAEPGGAARLVAYLTTYPGEETAVTLDALRSFLGRLLPDYMVPSAFVTLPSLPLNPNGKVDRRALPAPQLDLSGGPERIAPRNPVEELLADLFAQVLRIERIGVEESFLDLGGHSLLATQLVSRVRSAFQIELPLRALFEAPSVARLAVRVEQALRSAEAHPVPPILPVKRGRPLPLSFAQQRLWFLDQLQPGRADYNLPAALRLRGDLDRAALAAALAEIVLRHEILRTTFHTVADEPVQVIGPATGEGLPIIDLSGMMAREVEVRRLIESQARRPFDLTQGPLLRSTLFQLGPAEHVLLVTLHHIVGDGWSLWVLVRELRELYAAFAEGRPSPLPELTLQYADFACWQRAWLSGEVLDSELAYWRDRLAGIPPVLELPTDRPRPPVQTFQGAKVPLALSAEVSAALRNLGRQTAATPFMILMAGFQALLGRHAGQRDVCVGTPIAGRRQFEIERLIGFFVNTLVLRADLGGQIGFRQLLVQVKDRALAAYAHQDVPFERLVEELQPERDLSHAPLSQVTFTFQNAPEETLRAPGLELGVLDIETDTAKADLLLMLFDRPGSLGGHLQYSTDLFDPSTLLRLGQHLEALLAAAFAVPDLPLWELPLLKQAERHQLLHEWIAAGAAGPVPSLHALAESWAERTPDAIALSYEGELLTYRELDRRGNRLARHLAGLGIGPEVLVGLFVERSLEMVIGLLGVLKAGGTYVPLDPAYPAERIEFMVQEAGLLVLLTQERLTSRLPSFWGFTVVLDSDWETIRRESDERTDVALAPGNLANVIFTSGSTGQAKGVMVTQGGLAGLCAAQGRLFGLASYDRVLQFASLSFDAATWEIAMAISAGASLHLASRPALLPGPELVGFLKRAEISVATLPPSALAVLPEEPLPALRTLIVAGETCPPDLARRWGSTRRLVNAYGPTEATVCATAADFSADRGSLPIGRPILGAQVLVLDEALEPVPVGVSGEIHLSGSGLARGYLGRPELTAEAFRPHPASGLPGERCYRTGDAARYPADGSLEFAGRLDHQVKVRGFRIELGEVEAALATCPGIQEAAVVVREMAGGRGLMACVVAESGRGPEVHAWRQAMREKLPGYMVPSHFLVLAELPLTPNGKVDRAALATLAPELTDAAAGGGAMPLRTPTEEILASIFSEVLDIAPVGRTANFFELGGHSLLATRFVSRLRSALGVELQVAAVFDDPTLEALAKRVDQALQAGGGPAVRPSIAQAPRDRPLPLSFAQQRLWFLDQMEPESATYNLPVAVALGGALDLGALAAALRETSRRHESLRTTFESRGGEPVQVIGAATPVRLAAVDLRGLPAGHRRRATGTLAGEEARRVFDLAVGPLLRATILVLDRDEHVLLLTMHHIVSDGWSMNLLVGELATLYGAFSAGRPAALPELALQYADFAAWQRQFLTGDVLEGELAYWRAQLAGGPASTSLPADHPRSPRQTFLGARVRFRLPGDLQSAFHDLGLAHGATRFMVLLGAFEALLYRLTGQTDLSLGTPIAGRNHFQIEPLIGFFVNTLVLRTDLSADPSFVALLARVRATTLAAFAHQEVPFERLVSELRPERDLGRMPFFQILFVLDVPVAPPVFPALSVRPFPVESGTSKFDLTLTLAEEADGINGLLEYNVDLFEASTILRFAEHFSILSHGVARDPLLPLSSLPLLSDSEVQQVAVEWNDTLLALSPDALLHQLIGEQVARAPESVAVACDEEQLSYRELARRAGYLALRLRRLGVGPDVPVGIAAERSLELMVGLLGILESGGAYVPLDPSYPAERLSFMASDALGVATAAVLLTQSALAPRFAIGGLSTILLDGGEAGEDGDVAAPGWPEQLAYVIYTSGSTGRPKGSMNSHRAICNRLLWMQAVYGLESGDRVLQKTPMSFDVSVWELFWPLLRGARLVLARPEGHRDSGYLAETVAREGITTIHFVPSMLQVFLEEAQLSGCSSLRQIFASGEALSRELVGRCLERLPRAALHNLYGPTEAAVDVSFHACTAVDAERGVPIGRPIANLTLHVLGAGGALAPVGVAGELCIGGVGLSRGYLGRPALTAERFVPHPWRGEGERLYRTGDLARHRADGEIEYLGRLDHQVKIRGLRVELGEIESLLAEQPGVREAVAMVREEPAGGLGLVAYVTALAGGVVAAEVLRLALARRLPEALIPAAVVVLEALPLTPNGKVDREALVARSPRPEPSMAVRESAPRTPVEELLADFFAQVLRVDRVGIEDGFFDLGGHSLLATQLVSRVRESFGVELPLRALFEAPSVARLALRVEQALRSADAPALPPVPPIVRVARDRPLPLSFAQRRLWFLDQLQPGRADYNLPAALHLRGELDEGALSAALAEIVRRHESLRTTFETLADEPAQVIGPETAAGGVGLPVIDLSCLVAHESEVRRLVESEARRPFHLARGPLLRSTLVLLGAVEHVLLVTLHHIVGDAWSLGVLVRELQRLYAAFAERQPSPLPVLALQYADFAGWQRAWLSGEVLDFELAYWRERLNGVPPVLELPTDRPRPPVPTFRGANVDFELPPALSRQVQVFSRQRGATLFMTLLAAFQALLSRYTGQEDLALGTPIAGRNRLQTEGLIGFFVNTLVLRTDLSGDPSFEELLARVRETTLADFSHQDLPFEKLVEELQPARELNHAPFFQVVFVLQNAPAEPLDRPGLSIEPLPIENGTARFDLTLFAAEAGGRLIGRFEHNTDLLDRTTVERLAGHLSILLSGVVEGLGRRLSELPLLAPEEWAQVTSEWNPVLRAGDWEGPVHRLCELWAEREPLAPAVLWGEEALAYGELWERVERLAGFLRALGVGSEVLVGLAVEPSPDMIVGILGILAAGGAYVPLDPSYPPERLSFMLEDSGISLLLTEESLLERLAPFGRRLISLGESWEGPASRSLASACEVVPANVAYTIYTSGSTGTPKGVTVTHGGLASFTRAMIDLLALVPGDRMLLFASLSFDASVLQIFPTLAAGAALVLDPRVRHLSTSEIAQLCSRAGVTVLDLPAALWRQWVADRLETGETASPIRLYLTGGEAIPRTALRDWAVRVPEEAGFFISYGPTEATVTTTAFRLRARDIGEPELGDVPMGQPLANTRVYLLDPRAQPVPVGVPGEIYIGGFGVTRGYLHRPDLTAERYVPDPLSLEPGARLYRTGDLARYRPGGAIQFLGRRDGQIKLRGFRIELGEIEAALVTVPGVRECAVLVIDLAGDRRVVAYVVPQAEREVAMEDLRAALAERLPEPLVPSVLIPLAALPRLPSGKLDRRALPTPEARDAGLAGAVAPRTATETTLAAIWAEVLGLQEVGVHHDFFALGGHSLLATQVVSRARRAFGREIPLRLLFEARTVARMAESLEKPAVEEDLETAGPALEHTEPALGAGDLDSLLTQLEELSTEDLKARWEEP